MIGARKSRLCTSRMSTASMRSEMHAPLVWDSVFVSAVGGGGVHWAGCVAAYRSVSDYALKDIWLPPLSLASLPDWIWIWVG